MNAFEQRRAERERIEGLIASGALSRTEGQELLETLRRLEQRADRVRGEGGGRRPGRVQMQRLAFLRGEIGPQELYRSTRRTAQPTPSNQEFHLSHRQLLRQPARARSGSIAPGDRPVQALLGSTRGEPFAARRVARNFPSMATVGSGSPGHGDQSPSDGPSPRVRRSVEKRSTIETKKL